MSNSLFIFTFLIIKLFTITASFKIYSIVVSCLTMEFIISKMAKLSVEGDKQKKLGAYYKNLKKIKSLVF